MEARRHEGHEGSKTIRRGCFTHYSSRSATSLMTHRAGRNGTHVPRRALPLLASLAARLNLPETQLYLAHNGPLGAKPGASSRYPTPDWSPDGGWRVDKSLVYAHALQESRFRPDAVSPAGAYGVMQVLPGTAQLVARRRGQPKSHARPRTCGARRGSRP